MSVGYIPGMSAKLATPSCHANGQATSSNDHSRGKMYHTFSRKTFRAATLGAAIGLFACSTDDAATTDTGAAVADTGTAMMGDTGIVMPGPSASGLSDANIFYILDRANVLDSAAGAIASTKGTNSEIRQFGKMMTRDHHGLREQGQLLAKRLGITPAAPPNDTSAAKMSRAMSIMNAAAKGRDFDKAYIDYQVADHVNVLATATQAMAAAQNPELKNMIQKATRWYRRISTPPRRFSEE